MLFDSGSLKHSGRQSRPVEKEILCSWHPWRPDGLVRYFFAPAFMPYFCMNFSTRPSVSMIFCLPVKNGWQFEQISTLTLGAVERVTNVLPQAQVTLTSSYFGCIPSR